jgi:putative ABC transport system substrate-binding protein
MSPAFKLVRAAIRSPGLVRQSAELVDKIFKGAIPGDLPIEEPKKFDLVINRRTADALRLKLPLDLLVQATRLID